MQKGLFKKAESVKSLAERNGVTTAYVNDLIHNGMKFESEHSNDTDVQRTIAIQHLSENIEYYKALKKMEKALDKKATKAKPSFEKGGDLNAKLASTPAGGAIEKVENGKTEISNDGSEGGIFKGQRHSQANGGIDGVVDGSGQVKVENEEALIIPEAVNKPGMVTYNGRQMTNKQVLSEINTQAGGVPIKQQGGPVSKAEGGPVTEPSAGTAIKLKGSSVVITRNAVLDKSKKEFEGQMLSNREILSKINQSGGGAAFEEGGHLPEYMSCSTSQYNYGGKMMHAEEIATDMNNSCSCKHSMETGGNINDPNSKEAVLAEISTLQLPGVFKIAFKDKAWRLLKYIQEQATGMSGENSGVGENAYDSCVRMIGSEDLVKKCVALLPNTKKRRVLKYINDNQHRLPVPGGLIEALKINPGNKMEDGGMVTGQWLKYMRDLKKDFIFIVSLKSAIEKGTSTSGWDINLFKSSFYNKIAKLAKENRTDDLRTIFNYMQETEKVAKLESPIFTPAHKIFTLKPPAEALKPDIVDKEYPVDTPIRMSDIPANIKPFLPPNQLRAIIGNEELWEVIDRLSGIIKRMPQTYETDNTPTDDKIVYLHYFYGGSDWYIVEKDKGSKDDEVKGLQQQAFGYSIMNGDYEEAEWGYIPIEYMRNSIPMLELDFYFAPIPFGLLKKKWEDEPEEEEVIKKPTPKIGEFYYGLDFKVPEYYSGNLLNELAKRGFAVEAKKGQSVDLEKGGHRLYVNDNGGELNLGDIKTREHIGNVAYSITSGIVGPTHLADDIDELYKKYYLNEFPETEDEPDYEFVGGRNNSLDFVKFSDATVANQWLSHLGLAERTWFPHYMHENDNEKIPAGWYAKKRLGDTANLLTRGVFESALNESGGHVEETPIQYDENRQPVADDEEDDKDYDPAYGKALKEKWAANESTLMIDYGIESFSFDGLELNIDFVNGEGSLDLAAKAKPHDYSPNNYEALKAIQKFLLSDEEVFTISLGDRIIPAVFEEVLKKAGELSYDDFNHWYSKTFLLQRGNMDAKKETLKALGLDMSSDILQVYNEARKKVIKQALIPEQSHITDQNPTSKEIAADPSSFSQAEETGTENLMQLYKGKKQNVINNAIRALLHKKGPDRSKYSADELAFIKLYEGAGGLAGKGETGARLFDQFFTPMDICAKMWGFALKYGFSFPGSHILEPAVGSGRLLQFIPPDAKASVMAYDVDETAYTLCQVLFPDFDIRHGSFEEMFFKGNRHIGLAGVTEFFDLVIGNPPYRDYISDWAPLGEREATGASTFEMYFIARGVDVLKKGGLLVMLIPNTFLSNDKKYNDFKNKLIKKVDFLDAYRLPNGVFGNTDVGTDIIVLRKK